MVSTKRLTIACTGLIWFSVSGFAQTEDYSTWQHSKDVAVTAPFSLSGNLYNFPFLVQLSKSTFAFEQARKNGEDIRFAKTNGTALAYEIEKWDSAGQAAFVWVRIDTLRGTAQSIKMYWGKPAAAGRSNGPAVFAMADGYHAVWHLAGLGDATANSYALAKGADPATASGNIGDGMEFSGDGSLSSGTAPSLSGTQNFSVSAWIRCEKSFGPQYIISQRSPGYAGEYMLTVTPEGKLGFTLYGTDDAYQFTLTSARDIAEGTWHHVAGVRNGASGAIYVDGVKDGSQTGTARSLSNTFVTVIGKDQLDNGNAFTGKIDEVRLEKTVRSDDWIKLSCLNQKFMPAEPPSIRYPADTVYSNGTDYLTIAPALTGYIDQITVTPTELPSFLTVNLKNGEITGWLLDLSSRVTVVAMATNAKGSASDTVTILGDATGSSMQGLPDRSRARIVVRKGAAVIMRVPAPAGTGSIEATIHNLKGGVVWSAKTAIQHRMAGDVSLELPGPCTIAPGSYLVKIDLVNGSGGRTALGLAIVHLMQ